MSQGYGTFVLWAQNQTITKLVKICLNDKILLTLPFPL